MICCLQSSSKHAMQAGLSAPKIISLYSIMVFLMAFSSSSLVFIQFRRGIFNFFVSSKNDVLFIYISFYNPGRLQKPFLAPSTPKKIYHYHRSTCYIVGFLHQCICTLQQIPEDNNFYLVCRPNRSLTLPLHCNTYRMELLDHENLSICVLSTFSTYHGRTCLLLFSVLSPVFQISVTQQPHSRSFYIETPTPLPQKH